MKIAIVTTSYPAFRGDASGHFVEAEARTLCRVGHAVTVFAPTVSDDRFHERSETDILGEVGPELVRCPSGSAFGWPGALERLRENPLRVVGAARFVLAARRALSARGPFDRVVAHWVVPSAWPIASSCASELEVVAHGSDVRVLMRLPRPVRRSLLQALAHRATRVRCTSSELERLLLEECPVLSGRIRVEPSPFDLGESKSRADARRAVGLGSDGRVVVVVARLIASKRVDVALRAASLLDSRTVVLGDGPERGRLERQFPSAEFVGQVRRQRALDWMRAADLLLNASTLEGAPTVVREARALGTKVVSVPCSDLALWAESDAGLVVVPA